jgi:hypothetical protein
VATGAGELVVVAAAEAPHRGALVVVAAVAANGLVAPAVAKWLGPKGKYIEKKIKKKN